jgi:hypothetical protein
LEAVVVEQKAVSDAFRTAGTIDRIDRHNGRLVAADIKTAASVERLSYACQLVYAAHSVPYDVDTDERGEWPEPVATDVAHIYHYPLNRRLKGEPVEWTLVEVDIAGAIVTADQLRGLRHPNADEVAAKFTRPAVIDNHEVNDATPAGGDPIDELRAQVATWDADDRQELADMMTRESIDRTDAEQVAAAIDRYHFRDKVTEPQRREPVAEVPHGPTLNTTPDEGGDADPDAVDALERAYRALDDAARSWFKRLATDAGNLSLKDNRTVRRFEIVRGVATLCEGFDNDDAVRACIAAGLGEELAHSKAFSPGQLLGAMSAEEAKKFAKVADALVHYEAPMGFRPTGEPFIEVAA